MEREENPALFSRFILFPTLILYLHDCPSVCLSLCLSLCLSVSLSQASVPCRSLLPHPFLFNLSVFNQRMATPALFNPFHLILFLSKSINVYISLSSPSCIIYSYPFLSNCSCIIFPFNFHSTAHCSGHSAVHEKKDYTCI